jgi:uncharacterized membrane protein
MLTSARTRAAVVAEPGRPRDRTLRVSSAVWVLAGLTILAAALRMATISDQSYWVDEAQAAHELHLSFGAMLSEWSRLEGNPPLYFVLAWAWAKLFGTGEAGLRSFSVLAGTAMIPIAYLCARELVSRRAGVVAAALAAVNPFLIWYSQEAREYMLLAALTGLSLLFFARTWHSPARRALVMWTVISALALLTQYFAAFIVAPEAVLLLYRLRSRSALTAAGLLAALEAALIPHVLSNFTNQLQWVVDVPLAIRIEQVPIGFALGTLYQSPIVNYGLVGAAGLAAIVIALLVAGASPTALRGAGIAAVLAAAMLAIPLLLALVGHDNYVLRALIPAWIPVAVVISAACTAEHARAAGAVLGAVLLAASVYAGIRIDGNPHYQRPNWRAVAAALGASRGPRAIVTYDGTFAAGPLSLYLPGVPYSGPGGARVAAARPVSVTELDVVGGTFDAVGKLPAGTRRIGERAVDGYRVERFSFTHPVRGTPGSLAARAGTLLIVPGNPTAAGASVLIQPPSA